MTTSHPLLSRPVGSTAVETSILGFGTGAIGNRRTARTESDSIAIVKQAFDAGIRFFDAAPMYGHGLAERRLGAAVHELPRAELTISSKVGKVLRPAPIGTFDEGIWTDVPPFTFDYDYTYDGAMRSIEATLNRMLVDHLSIAFIHDPDHYTHGPDQPAMFRDAMGGARKALLKLKDEGVIGAVGMGVNDTSVVLDGADAGGFDVFLLAGKYTLLNQASLDDLMPRAVSDGFSIVIGSVFNSGILATGATPNAYYDNEPPTPEIVERVNAFEAVAKRYDVPLATVAFQFALAHPAVCSVLVGMGTTSQLERNVAMVDTVIPDALWEELRDAGLIRPDAPTPSAGNAS